MSTFEDQTGKRLLATQIDHLAKNSPERTWATIPNHPADVSKGYRDISFKQFANAINHAAHWLSKTLTGAPEDFETITYNGPFDIQYPILAVAAVKCGKRLLLTSPWATPTAQVHLLNQSKCTTYLHSPFFTPRLKPLFDAVPHIRTVEAPMLHEWLNSKEAPHYPYEKTWEEAASDPWIIFHTSGTTGLPKMIIYTNLMMTSFDAAKLMPDASNKNTMNAMFNDQRYFAPIPPCHYTGMTAALQWPVYLDNIFVGGPTAGPVTGRQAVDVVKLAKVDGIVMAPSLIEEMCREPDGLEILRGLEWVSFAGAALAPHVAKQLKGHCVVMPGMGSTEAGTYWTSVAETDDSWDCYQFRPANGIVMEPRGGDLYELVWQRKPEFERWQQVFKVFPELDSFPTKDLFVRHPSEPDAWRYVGRLDDLVIMHHGHKLNATELQHIIQEAPSVRAALIGGELRMEPFLIVDLVEPKVMSAEEREEKLTEIWPSIEKANAQCTENIQIVRDLVQFTDPARPLPMTAKGTVVRPGALELYSEDINQLYQSHETRKKLASVSLDVKPVAASTITVTEQQV